MSQRDRELRRLAMRGVPERLGLELARGDLEMRAKPNGTAAGSSFEFRGYATVYDQPFSMWDRSGEPYTESVAQGACKRSLSNPNLDVPFLIGHDDSGVPLARTKSGTMKLSEDSRGLHVHVPAMDGRREEVRALASAIERGDLSEMSLAFVCNRQEWDEAFEHRTVMEMDIHRGDVCAVTHGANPATDGISMMPIEQLSLRRPVAIGGPVLLDRERRAAMSLAEQHGHPGKPCIDPDGDGDCDLTPEGDTDHDYWTADGRQVKPLPGADGGEGRALSVPYELLSVTQAERDKAKAAGNSLADGSYPINNVAQLHSAAVLAASHHGDWKAAQALIRRRAKELGVDVSTLPGFGEEKSSGLPLEAYAPSAVTFSVPGAEQRASAAEDMDVATSSDYNPSYDHAPMTGTHTHAVPHTHTGSGHSANIIVDGQTGIPGEEQQFSAARRLELRLRMLELEELAAS